MITAAVASPATISSGIWFRRHRVSFSCGLPSASRNLFTIISTLYPAEKDVVSSSRAFESHILGRVSLHPLATKFRSNNEAEATAQLLKNTDDLASLFEDVTVSDLEASSGARKSRKERNPQRLRSSSAQINKLDHLPVIRYPLRTESAIKALLESNTLIFVVDKHADKKNIKDTVEKMFKIRAKKVNTLIMPDGTKKGYIMLAPDCNALDVAKKIKIL